MRHCGPLRNGQLMIIAMENWKKPLQELHILHICTLIVMFSIYQVYIIRRKHLHRLKSHVLYFWSTYQFLIKKSSICIISFLMLWSSELAYPRLFILQFFLFHEKIFLYSILITKVVLPRLLNLLLALSCRVHFQLSRWVLPIDYKPFVS